MIIYKLKHEYITPFLTKISYAVIFNFTIRNYNLPHICYINTIYTNTNTYIHTFVCECVWFTLYLATQGILWPKTMKPITAKSENLRLVMARPVTNELWTNIVRSNLEKPYCSMVLLMRRMVMPSSCLRNWWRARTIVSAREELAQLLQQQRHGCSGVYSAAWNRCWSSSRYESIAPSLPSSPSCILSWLCCLHYANSIWFISAIGIQEVLNSEEKFATVLIEFALNFKCLWWNCNPMTWRYIVRIFIEAAELF